MVSSMLYVLVGVVGTLYYDGTLHGFARTTLASLATMAVLFVIARVGAAVGLRVARFVGDTPGVEGRERMASAALFIMFMVVVSVVSVLLGMRGISGPGHAVPVNFWLAIPPGSALVIVPHPERWRDKIQCWVLSLVVYALVCAGRLWWANAGVSQAVGLSVDLFVHNYVINWYVVAFICGFLTEITTRVFIAAELIADVVGRWFQKGKDDMRIARKW
jgi:hypothetical protein